MKSILISIRPEWVAKILNGEKTIEVRKSVPKCELPVDVYIYCTKGHNESHPLPGTQEGRKLVFGNHMVYYDEYTMNGTPLNGNVVAKFTLRKVEKTSYRFGLTGDAVQTETYPPYYLERDACLSTDELMAYTNGGRKGYAWHISDLEIFDRTKDLSEFGTFRKIERGGPAASVETYRMEFVPLKKAPESWQYVEEE